MGAPRKLNGRFLVHSPFTVLLILFTRELGADCSFSGPLLAGGRLEDRQRTGIAGRLD